MAHLYRVTTQIMSTLERNKSELLSGGNSQAFQEKAKPLRPAVTLTPPSFRKVFLRNP
jgi:hypothetical protein